MPHRTILFVKCLPLLLFALAVSAGAAPQKPIPGPVRDLTREIDFKRIGTFHLGPIGARGWMHVSENFMTDQARQILITEVDVDGPAAKVLQAGDVILGAGGSRFENDARKSLGRAIDEAETEKNKGVLELIRWRPIDGAKPRRGKEERVSIQLKVMGAYSDTAPYDCPKTRKIKDDAIQVLLEKKDWGKFGDKALALLATGDEKHIKLVRDYIHKESWARPDVKISLERGGLVCWGLGYRNLLLTEYYLATGDKYVLPAIREHAVKISMGQSGGGTWGHGFAWTNVNGGKIHGTLGGYGALNQAGLPCLLSLVLAKKCGIEHPEIDDAIGRASRFFRKFVDNGSIGYGYHRPSLEIYANGRNGMSGNGKNGIASVVFRLLGDRESTRFFSRLTTSLYNTCEYGHSGNSYSYFWDPIGANCTGPGMAAAFQKELRWYYALTRMPDGRFVNQPLGGIYGRGLLDPTVTQVLMATMPRKAIYLTGKETDRTFWLGKEEVRETIAAGRWRHADTDKMSVDEMIDELDCWSPIGREWIARKLAKKENVPIERLVKMLGSDKREARAGACAALGYQGERAAGAVAQITKALEDEEPIVCISASYALARINKPAREAVPAMLRAVLAAEEEGFMRPQQQAMSFALGYSQGRTAPLYFQGLLPGLAEEGNPIEKVDRKLLYPVVEKLLDDSAGRTRGCGAYMMKFFTRQDTANMAQQIHDAIVIPATNYVMFDDMARQAGLDLFARHRIAEGIPLIMETIEQQRWGQGTRSTHRIQAIGAYGGNARRALPWLRQMRWVARNSKTDRPLIDASIKAIETDKNPEPLVSLHTLVDQRLERDLAGAKNEAQQVKMCREFIKKNPDDYFYQAACLRKIVAIEKDNAIKDILAAIGSDNDILREQAIQAGASLASEKAGNAWRKHLNQAAPAQQAALLEMLAATGDDKWLAVMEKHLANENQAISIAAIKGIGRLGDGDQAQLLVKLLSKTKDPAEREAIEETLASIILKARNGKRALGYLALAAREDNPEIQDSFLRVLGKTCTLDGLILLVQGSHMEKSDYVRAASPVLAMWNKPGDIDILINNAIKHSEASMKRACHEGCLRLLIIEDLPEKKKLEILDKLLEIGGGGRNVATALNELQWIPSLDSLRLAQASLEQRGREESAAQAVLAIARGMDLEEPKERNAVVETLKKALQATKRDNTKAEIKEFLEGMDDKPEAPAGS